MDESGVSSNPGYLLYEGNGFIKNKTQLVFNTAMTDWGWVSGIAILDDTTDGAGKLLMYAELNNQDMSILETVLSLILPFGNKFKLIALSLRCFR